MVQYFVSRPDASSQLIRLLRYGQFEFCEHALTTSAVKRCCPGSPPFPSVQNKPYGEPCWVNARVLVAGSLFHFTFNRGRRPSLFCLYRLVSQFISLAYDLRASEKQLAIRELCRRGPESDDAGGGFLWQPRLSNKPSVLWAVKVLVCPQLHEERTNRSLPLTFFVVYVTMMWCFSMWRCLAWFNNSPKEVIGCIYVKLRHLFWQQWDWLARNGWLYEEWKSSLSRPGEKGVHV